MVQILRVSAVQMSVKLGLVRSPLTRERGGGQLKGGPHVNYHPCNVSQVIILLVILGDATLGVTPLWGVPK